MAKAVRVFWVSAMVWLLAAEGAEASMALYPPRHVLTKAGLESAPDPVSADAGSFHFALPLLELGGPLGLGFTLRYDSNGVRASWDQYDLPEGGAWWWDPLATCQPVEMGGGTNCLQIQIENADTMAFIQEPDGSWRLVEEGDFGFPNSPVDFRVQQTNGWTYFLDPRRGRVTMFENVTNKLWRIAAQVDRNGNALTYSYRELTATNPIQWTQPIRIEDGLGRWIELEYAEFGWNWETYVVGARDHAGRAIRLDYENGGDIVGQQVGLRHAVDAMGGTNRFTYAPFTNDFTIYRAGIGGHRLPAGNTPWTQTYDAFQLYSSDGAKRPAVTNQTDAYGNAISFAYDTNAHMVAATWPDGGSNVFRHAGRAQPPVEAVAPGGARTTFAVDGRSRIAGITDATGAGIGFGFDPASALISSVTNSAGEVLRFEYAATDQVITNPAAPGETVAFTFHDLAAIRYPDGTSEEFRYDGRGNATGIVDRAGQTTAYAYDRRGNLARQTSPGGGETAFQYDGLSRLVAAADADGVTNRFEYDALDRATNVVDGAGHATAYAYDTLGRMTAVADPLGGRTEFEFDANGNLLETTAPDGVVESAVYDLMNRVAVATNALGGAATRTYDAMGYLTEFVGPDGATNRFLYDHAGRVTNETRAGVSVSAAYDAEGRMVSRASGRGFEQSFAYDPDGRLAAATNALGHARRFDRDAAGRVTNVVDELGQATAYAYEDGRPTARTDAEGRTAQMAYDSDGRLSVATDSAGARTTFGYTPAGRLAAVTNALGAASAYAYDAAGRLARLTDELGRSTDYAYDAAGRLAGVTDAASNDWAYAYDPAGRVIGVTNPLDGAAATTYLPGGYPSTRADSDTGIWSNRWDAAGRLVETADPLGNATAFAYDDFGRVAAVTNPLGNAVGFEYDADGNLVRSVDELGAATRLAYDALGQVTSVVDRAGGETAFEYDAAGRRVRTADADGVAVETDYDATGRPLVRRAGAEAWTNAYDAAGRLASVASPLGHVQTLRRDALGRVTNTVDAAGGVAIYEYDAAGRLVAETDAEGRATAYEYDLLDGLARVTLPGGGFAAYERDALGNVVRIADLGGHEWTRAWTPMGRWLEDVDPLGRTNACERDELGRVARFLRADGSTVDVRYDAAGQVTGRVYSAGLALAYEYDAAGRLAAADGVALARDGEGRATNALVNGRNYAAAWTPGGRLAAVAYADGAFAVAYAYDPVSGRLATVSDALTGTQVGFEYDADGRLVRQTDSHGGTNEFTYDAAGRVTRIQATPGIDLQYVYDAAGRLVSETREVPKPAGALLAAAADVNSFDAAAQLANPSAAYDPLGRRTADDRHAYAWRADGRLAAVDSVTNQYDAFGNIMARDGQPLACHPAIGGAPLVDDGTNWYVWTPGGALLYAVAQAPGHAVHHVRFDRSGHAIALVDTNGAVAEAYAYEPGGLELDPAPSALGNPFRFLGRYGIRAEGTGDLYHVRARWYDARTRAFLSPEPLWPQTANPHALNPYVYARANPVNFADINGEVNTPDPELRKYIEGNNSWQKVDVPADPKKKVVGHADAPGHDLWGFVDGSNSWGPVDDPDDYKNHYDPEALEEAFKDLDKATAVARSRWQTFRTTPYFIKFNYFEAFHNAWMMEWFVKQAPAEFARNRRNRLREIERAEFAYRFGLDLPSANGTVATRLYEDFGAEKELVLDQLAAFENVKLEVQKAERRQREWERGVREGRIRQNRLAVGTRHEIKTWQLDLVGNTWTPQFGGISAPPPSVPKGGVDVYKNNLHEFVEGHNGWQEVDRPAKPDKKAAGSPPGQDFWELVEGSDSWQKVDVPSDPRKKANSAVATHLGKGAKRQTLLNLVVLKNALPPGTKVLPRDNKEIKLSFDWEGDLGSLDVKPFHLGKQGY